jgi:hypothetical protein
MANKTWICGGLGIAVCSSTNHSADVGINRASNRQSPSNYFVAARNGQLEEFNHEQSAF